jgi:tetratricopeptide (TPR) repeat protein
MSASDTFALPSDLDALAKGVDWSEGVAFFFLVVDDVRMRQAAVAELTRRLHRRQVRRVSIRDDARSLLDVIRELPPLTRHDVLVITGIENVIRDSRDPVQHRFIRTVNATRDAFSRVAPCPIVFVIPAFALAVIATEAPDFFSTRSGVYVFAEDGGATTRLRDASRIGREIASDLDALERIDRVETLEELLKTISFVDSPAARQTYLNVAERLVTLLVAQYDLGRAEHVARQALEVAEGFAPRYALEFASNLGQIALLRGDVEGVTRFADLVATLANTLGDPRARIRSYSMQAYAAGARADFALEERCYLEALTIAEQLSDIGGQARLHQSIGRVALQLGDSAKALDHLRRAMELAERDGDRPLLAEIRASAGDALARLGRFEEAEESILASIADVERRRDSVQLSVVLVELGDLRVAQERFAEAEAAYLESIALIEASAPVLPSRIVVPLARLANLYAHVEQSSKALQFAKRALSVLDELRLAVLGATELKADLRALIAQLDVNP